ncbi:MAG: WD40/YVTN/BNR-like repeat-containing protein [Candidatus Thorarchaeota archaeon]
MSGSYRRVALVFLSYILLTQSFSFVLGSEAFVQQQTSTWEMVNHPFSADDALFWDIRFVNSTHGWIVGSNASGWIGGLILQTTNSGDTWNLSHYDELQRFTDICVLDSDKLWIAGRDRLLYTTNGGDDWSESLVIHDSAPVSFWSVDFINESHGWTSSTDVLYKTTNGGMDWNLVSSWTFEDTARRIHFQTSNIGWVIGFFGIYRTSNGGDSWTQVHSNGGWAMSFVSDTEGWAVDDNMIAHTLDGNTWIGQSIPRNPSTSSYSVPYFAGVFFIDSNHGWIVGRNPLIMYTPNGGSDWYEQSTPESARLRSVDFINSTHGWAVGQDGNILRTASGDDLGEELVVDTVNLPLILSLVLITGIIGIVSIVIWRRKRILS